jgi:hypothetical protein
MVHDRYGCDCLCPASLTIEEEIKMLESHKNNLQDQIEFLNQKIALLKAVKVE